MSSLLELDFSAAKRLPFGLLVLFERLASALGLKKRQNLIEMIKDGWFIAETRGQNVFMSPTQHGDRGQFTYVKVTQASQVIRSSMVLSWIDSVHDSRVKYQLYCN